MIKYIKEDLIEITAKKILQWFNKNRKLAFVVTLILAFLVHIYIMVNQMPNADGVVYTTFQNGFNWELSLGRWMYIFAYKIRSYMVLPIYLGIFSSVCLALSSVFIVDIFKVKKNLTIILISVLVVVFPTVSASFIYYYCADTFFLSMFLSVFAVWLMLRKNWISYVLSIISIVISLASYQSYIGVTVALCFSYLFKELLENNNYNIKVMIKDALKFVIIGGIGLVLYFISVKVFNYLYHVNLADYMGMQQMGEFKLNMLGELTIQAYTRFYDFFFTNLFYNNGILRKSIYSIFLISFIISIIGNIKKEKVIIVSILLLLLPIAFNIIVYMVPTDIAKLRMMPGMLILLILILSLNENHSYFKFEPLFKNILILSTIMLSFNYYILTQAVYLNVQLNFNKAYSLTLRILDRIEQNENFNKDMPIAIMGWIKNDNYPTVSPNIATYVERVNSADSESLYINTMSSWYGIIRQYAGGYITKASANQISEILDTDEFKEMPSFPSKDCIKTINNVLVIKISEIMREIDYYN